ncbi:glutamine--tRNA ligase/YqeY domain fusion protein [Lujinxingia vulgaris]|uniref:Glutamine--tRNA ligase n=1 Tax=Lujinxingia vulgaris TaxID=2600176 RepID=A0A5C6XD57_9DELT|nr:glutamine--tRNA ligase/YqeY domain fusion protein [Lujinxingia vulgaris]TXD37211.1 glutamine--tRNA ligase/YqeY domain fusion protein [Lujinxingia vulgaris]
MTNPSDTPTPSNFIHDIIDADLEAGRVVNVVTRFPPEPNGYLHIGHAKSIVLNFGIAQKYGGQCHLRFDDTNPLTEDEEYVASIQNDVRWLGYDWGEHLYFASNYFEKMYACALHLVKEGKAYVDSQSQEEIRQMRGTLTEPGKPSPYRERSVEENLELLEKMRAGEFGDGEHVLRAKIDMSNPNMLMRDPLIYRIRHATHHNTGDDWCIYPMYDFAHALEDAFEGVTHSICTLEFENNRELYDWVIANCPVKSEPHQYEFARLNLGYTVMSKRKLLQLVRDEVVQGWDDPRMPTIAGMRRRGVPPEALRAFCQLIGVAKANSTVDIQLLEYAIRDELNMKAPRVMAVIDPVKVVITNYPEDQVEWLDADYFPHDVPLEGTRKVPFSRELYIERDDYLEDAPKKWYRLAPGAEVRLRYGYYITCDEAIYGEDGELKELRCTYDPESRGGSTPDGRKVRGTIHWVSAAEAKPATFNLYDRLFTVERPDGDSEIDFQEYLNPESLVVAQGFVEPSVADDADDVRYQFERQGYFWRDSSSSNEALVFNRVVGLRDSWSKQQKKDEPKQATPKPKAEKSTKDAGAKASSSDDRPNKRPASYERDQARAANPELAARQMRYAQEMGLSEDDADLLSGDMDVATFFEAALSAYDTPASVAPWIVNEVLPLVPEEKTVAALDVSADDVATLVKMVDADRITTAVSREVLQAVLEGAGDPEKVVAERGLEKVSDAASLEPVIDEVMANNPDNVARYREGKTTLLGFFIGQVMRATGGAADAVKVREMLERKLGEG